jgi:hypothetical protein
VAVGSLLQGAAPKTKGAVDEAAAVTTAAMWDDAVLAMKLATGELEEQAKGYHTEVQGFVKGLDELDKLVGALRRLPADHLPRQPDEPADGGGGGGAFGFTFRFDGLGSMPTGEPRESRRFVPPQSLPMPGAFGPCRQAIDTSAAQSSSIHGGGDGAAANGIDSGSRLFDKIAEMGQEMWSGIRSNRSATPSSTGDVSPAPAERAQAPSSTDAELGKRRQGEAKAVRIIETVIPPSTSQPHEQGAGGDGPPEAAEKANQQAEPALTA